MVEEKDEFYNAHRDAYEFWPHGAPARCWIDEGGDLCIEYEDGQWYHYRVVDDEVVWW